MAGARSDLPARGQDERRNGDGHLRASSRASNRKWRPRWMPSSNSPRKARSPKTPRCGSTSTSTRSGIGNARGGKSHMARMSVREAISQALREEMYRDERVFIMGEEIGKWGGTYAVTRGFLDEFGEKRVRDTPIAEGVIVGAARRRGHRRAAARGRADDDQLRLPGDGPDRQPRRQAALHVQRPDPGAAW